jgi:hypothetical protein
MVTADEVLPVEGSQIRHLASVRVSADRHPLTLEEASGSCTATHLRTLSLNRVRNDRVVG